jgi:hypothetical protein
MGIRPAAEASSCKFESRSRQQLRARENARAESANRQNGGDDIFGDIAEGARLLSPSIKDAGGLPFLIRNGLTEPRRARSPPRLWRISKPCGGERLEGSSFEDERPAPEFNSQAGRQRSASMTWTMTVGPNLRLGWRVDSVFGLDPLKRLIEVFRG